ncbi:MAG: hypothetical protein DRO88_00165 [Promethearchaeia archaeon]|nr:MAG: hypothetical protein DRO88_00165 [Candidatus Lokiarchaeia archaeon]
MTASEEKTSDFKDDSHYLQIDILKGLMILLVIIDHAIPWDVRAQWGHSLWERISIPVFLIIMGFNSALSFRKKGIPLESFHSYMKYIWHKFKRFYIPFGLLFIVSTIFGLIYYSNFTNLLEIQFYPHWPQEMLWNFILPFYGPGNWFIPVLFQAMLILPLLYWVFRKAPKMTLVASFLFELGVQYFNFVVNGHYVEWWPNVPLARTMLQTSVLFYINALFIGFWIAHNPHLIADSVDSISNIQTKTKTLNKKLNEKVPFHFYLVILALIVLGITVIVPNLKLILGRWQAVMIVILLIVLCLGFYFYRPLNEFAKVFSISILITIGFLLIIDKYGDLVWIDWETRTCNAESTLFFEAIVVFAVPYVLNIIFSPKNRNFFLWMLGITSATYLSVYHYDDFRFLLITGDYHFLVYPYSALIVMVFLSVLPKNSNYKILKGFSTIGKASYHILLTQIFAYGIILAVTGDHYLVEGNAIHTMWFNSNSNYVMVVWLYVALMWLICVPIGLGWYFLENYIRRKLKNIAN